MSSIGSLDCQNLPLRLVNFEIFFLRKLIEHRIQKWYQPILKGFRNIINIKFSVLNISAYEHKQYLLDNTQSR